ncbi:MAG: hypothetical protein LC749_20735 [Actinobacteria bacterium]|nr:hypothetical protein [Actinomycetota bacterium]
MRLAGAVEHPSEYPVGQAIAHAARSEVGTLPAVEHFRNRPGLGVVGTVEGHEVTVGRGEGGIEVAWDGAPRARLVVRDN